MRVNIYLETDKQCQAYTQRKYGYVIETVYNGQIETREGFGSSESTYHQCNLQALAQALKRFHAKCEVCVYTKDAFVAARVQRISDLAAVDFKDTKDKNIKNADEWKKVYQKVSELDLQIISCVGNHSYSQWLLEAMMKNGDK